MADKGQEKNPNQIRQHEPRAHIDSFVLDKSIFSNIFEKDIRRVFIYKKAERLAKAIQLVSPAFRDTPALRQRTDQIAIGLVDAAILSPSHAQGALSRELLALSSVLSMARSGGLLSSMNAELIAREAHLLLQEVAEYVEPRLFLDDAPTLAMLARDMAVSTRPAPAPGAHHASRATHQEMARAMSSETALVSTHTQGQSKGHKQTAPASGAAKKSSRREAILSVLRSKPSVYIKDVSTVLREVSEKTIQRELQAMTEEGIVTKSGERRWTTYALA